MSDWQDALFSPRRVAIVGASASPGKAGSLFLRNLKAVGARFSGEVVAVHPSAKEILGCPAYPNLSAAPEPVDLAIVVTPPATVPGVVADCGAAGVRVAVVISGGFAETGAAGAELQREAARVAIECGVRVLGPNCFGVINTTCGLNGSLSIGLPKRGGVSLVTQSGAYGMAAYSRSTDDGVGFAKIVARVAPLGKCAVTPSGISTGYLLTKPYPQRHFSEPCPQRHFPGPWLQNTTTDTAGAFTPVCIVCSSIRPRRPPRLPNYRLPRYRTRASFGRCSPKPPRP